MWQVFRVIQDYDDRWEVAESGEVFETEREADDRCDQLQMSERVDSFIVKEVV